MYLDPLHPRAPRRDAKGRRTWVRHAWEWFLAEALGNPAVPPDWADTLALTRFTLSSPRPQAWFSGYDAAVPTEERMRPGSFGLLAQVAGLMAGDAGVALPAAPYESDPTEWPELSWYDRRDARPIEVIASPPGADPEREANQLVEGSVALRMLGEVLAGYRRRPEHKSLGPDGSPRGPHTAGLLSRRPVRSAAVLTDLIGKEGNRLEERATGEITEPDQYRHVYGSRGNRFSTLVVPVFVRMPAQEIADAVGLTRRQVERIQRPGFAGRPHEGNRRALTTLAVRQARSELELAGCTVPGDDDAVLFPVLRERDGGSPRG